LTGKTDFVTVLGHINLDLNTGRQAGVQDNMKPCLAAAVELAE